MTPTPASARIHNASRLFRSVFWFYLVFVVYGSLVPLQFRSMPVEQALQHFSNIPYLTLGIGSRADWVANILLYLPLGFLAGARHVNRHQSRFVILLRSIALLTAILGLAIGIEFAQQFFQPRTVSLNDLLAEGLGAAVGLAIWIMVGHRLIQLIRDLDHNSRGAIKAVLTLYLIVYLFMSLLPFDFLLSFQELAWKVNSGNAHLLFSCTTAFECTTSALFDMAACIPIGLLLGALSAGTSTASRLKTALISGVLLGLLVEALQFIIASGVSQGISILLRIVGIAIGIGLQSVIASSRLSSILQRRAAVKWWFIGAIPPYLIISAWMSWHDKGPWLALSNALTRFPEIHFLPFYYHYYTSESAAMANVLVTLAIYFPLGILTWLGRLSGGRFNPLFSRSASLLYGLAGALIIEGGKLFLQSTHPDPTNILIGGWAAWMAYLLADKLWPMVTLPVHAVTAAPVTAVQTLPPRRKQPHRRVPGKRRYALALTLVIGGILSIGVVGISLVGKGVLWQLKESVKMAAADFLYPKLPSPDALPVPTLPDFRGQHPRLPAPTPQEIATLRTQNPGYLQLKQFTAKNRGNANAAIIAAYMAPGSQDLNALFNQLMALKFTDRGNEQTKPIAVAYDWLYSQWNEQQRVQLREKLIEGCDYQIKFIRDERLSPYNVYLYNSPFQALMACSIALYQDDPRGDPIMAFTYDFWKNRVLPVWRQVMGENGGWHETGGYAASGIGQAIYQVPAMWRKATGEDIFKTDPRFRGFLDFLVYRQRPDGTHFRWGDSGFFDREVPDRVALALEYRHAAAYNLKQPPTKPTPTAWPWGPLTDNSLIEPGAQKRLPLAKYLDGIGMLIARNQWGPDATYLSFKVGNNYWSHSHLDQGAFEIYKGGPLAIDSGLYNKYGSEHHMNYSYQTIAHNTITVTDPDDTVPGPPAKRSEPSQHYANDGGQRRIGSGWRTGPAPRDLEDWQKDIETYHTGDMRKVFIEDSFTVGIGDVTPAYTNELSGKDTFAHRTRRVDKFIRLFGYDQKDDVIVIFDQVIASNAAFRKRWLLHTIEQPRTRAGSFKVSISPIDKTGRAGGGMEGRVLLPAQAKIELVGGPGREYEVDGVNYDEGGKATQHTLSRSRLVEPGAWRIEIQPPTAAREDHFLVVLLPTIGQGKPAHQIRLLQQKDMIGCEIKGPKRTTRWWFSPDLSKAWIESVENGVVRRHELAK